VKVARQVSVRALVEHSLRAGDLSLESPGLSTTVEAIRAHQKVQASRGKGYQKEVTVSGCFERDGVSLFVSGRIDGVWERESGLLIEEIKTTRDDPEERALRESPTHWGQLKVYAFFCAKERGLEFIDTRLTYYQLESGRTVEIERRFALSVLETFVDDLVSRYLAFVARVEAWVAERNLSIDRASFPFPAYRIGQRDMAVAVYRTIREGGKLLVRAPTGVGKTHGALFPSVKALGEGETDRIFYLTARTTGRGLAERALSQLRNGGVRIRAVTLTAKEKICFNPEKACNGEECEFARGFYDRLSLAVDEAFEIEELNRASIETLARKHGLCPFELSLELTPLADVVIGDYNHAFDPRTQLRRFFRDGSPQSTVLVDEAHNLADRARDMFSASISRESFRSLKRLFPSDRSLGSLLLSLGKVTAAIGRARDEAGLAEIVAALSGFLGKSEVALQRPWTREVRRKLVESVFEAAWFSKVAEQFDKGDETYAVCCEARGRDRIVTLFCTDPAPNLKETFESVKAATLFSATLSPIRYFRRNLGLGMESRAIELPPAFPPENLLVLIADGIGTTYRKRGSTEAELTALLTSFVSQKRGNYFLYFPSYEYLRAIHERFARTGPDAEVLVQEPGMSDAAREAFLDRFSARDGTLVGFAVMGGIFGEGIDLPGETLEGAAIVGVGLPALSMKRDRIRARFDHTERAGFDYAYVYPGINRVLQAAGRVIRSETDRGTVLLVDERFRERKYRALLPPEWTPRFVRDDDELGRELAEFWEE
jgi:DNA excision repair protein ERCC-2